MLNKQVLIFDLDGTLYELEGGSFSLSPLAKQVKKNVALYIQKKINLNEVETEFLLTKIKEEYGENISIALEEKYGLNRYDYFNNVWNISAHGLIRYNSALLDMLPRLKDKYIFAIVTDSPAIWAQNVLAEMGLSQLFEGNIFTGEGNERKIFGNGFTRVLEKFRVSPGDCISIGDQESTDIEPAKKLGFRTIRVTTVDQTKADYTINNILDLEQVLS